MTSASVDKADQLFATSTIHKRVFGQTSGEKYVIIIGKTLIG